MIKRLRTKFVCINMLIVTVMLCIIFGLTLHMTHKNMETENIALLRSVMAPDKKDDGKQDKQEKPISPADEKQRAKQEKAYKPMSEARKPTFTLYKDGDGNLIATGSDYFDLSNTEYLQQLYAAAEAMDAESAILEEYSLRFLRSSDPHGLRFSFADITNEIGTIKNLIWNSVMIGLIAFASFLLVSIYLSRWAIKPVERAWTQQRQFIADASHELKTPLTVIMTNAELMRDSASTEADRQQCAENVLDMSRRMRTLTEEMLNLARADNAQETALTETCDLAELLEDSVLSLEALFFERGLTLQSELTEGLTVKGDHTQLRQLAEILLDNAQKYSLPGTVDLQLKKQNGKHCLLSISNPAEPISEEELKHIFERFYRVDKARSSTGSYGLGLSIADSIVTRHHGSIQADYADGRLRFTVRLPLCT